MHKKPKRIYSSKTRQAQAAHTRAQILQSAKLLFQTHGFTQVTIAAIAKAADVSMPTIYALFKSKRGVLQALIDEALPFEQFTTLVDDCMQEGSAEKRLHITAKLARHIYDAEKDLMDILHEASVAAPEFKELEQEREARRYERQSDYVKKLMETQALAKGMSYKEARDILWTLTGRDIYRMLVVERGWDSESYQQWLGQLLIKSLL